MKKLHRKDIYAKISALMAENRSYTGNNTADDFIRRYLEDKPLRWEKTPPAWLEDDMTLLLDDYMRAK